MSDRKVGNERGEDMRQKSSGRKYGTFQSDQLLSGNATTLRLSELLVLTLPMSDVANGCFVLLLIEAAGLRLLESKLLLQNAGLYCRCRGKITWNNVKTSPHKGLDICVYVF